LSSISQTRGGDVRALASAIAAGSVLGLAIGGTYLLGAFISRQGPPAGPVTRAPLMQAAAPALPVKLAAS
jgi:hypothetical protein